MPVFSRVLTIITILPSSPFPSKASACQGGPGFCEARGEVAGLDMDYKGTDGSERACVFACPNNYNNTAIVT